MNQEMLLWLLGQTLVYGSIGIGAYIKLIQRVTKVETFISLLGTKAARALHSPDNHLGLDGILDEYLKHGYEMSTDSWVELHESCEIILKDKNVKQSERALAAMLSAVCEHKLIILRPGFRKTLEDKASDSIVKSAMKLI